MREYEGYEGVRGGTRGGLGYEGWVGVRGGTRGGLGYEGVRGVGWDTRVRRHHLSISSYALTSLTPSLTPLL